MHALTLLAPAGGLAAAGGLATAAPPAAACCALAVLGSQARPLSSLRPRVAHADPQEAARAPSRWVFRAAARAARSCCRRSPLIHRPPFPPQARLRHPCAHLPHQLRGAGAGRAWRRRPVRVARICRSPPLHSACRPHAPPPPFIDPALSPPPAPPCSGFASSALPETAPKGKAAPAAKAAGKGAAGVPAPTIDVQKWVRDSITPWDGDTSFLAKPTQRTLELWDQVQVGAGRCGRSSGALRRGTGTGALPWLPPPTRPALAGHVPRGVPCGMKLNTG